MWLNHLQAQGVRCLESVDVHLHQGVNVLSGDNGSGKTSFLEAVYLLGHGRSFRSRHAREVVGRGRPSLTVFGSLRDDAGHERRVGLSWHSTDGQTIRVDGAPVRSSSNLARLAPMVVVNADAQRVLSDGAGERRAVLDWLLFHVEPGYHEALRLFRRALAQRNAALRCGSGSTLASWTFELAGAGDALQAMREVHAAELLKGLGVRLAKLVGQEIEVGFFKGWSSSESLHDVLVAASAEDRRQQRTRFGPQRADLRLRTAGRPIHRMLSRGESKLLVYALALAQVTLVAEARGIRPMLLLDDLPAELDAENRARFLSELAEAGVQAVITSVVANETVDAMPGGHKAAVFHVKQGEIAPVV